MDKPSSVFIIVDLALAVAGVAAIGTAVGLAGLSGVTDANTIGAGV